MDKRILIAAAVIVVALVIAVALVLPKPGAPTPTKTTPAKTTPAKPTPTTTTPTGPTLTGNLEKDLVSIAKYLEKQGVKTVSFTVWGSGDPNSVMRVYGIVEAAYRLNKILEKNGLTLRIKVTPKFERGGGIDLTEFITAYKQNANPDIVADTYIHIATLAEQGYLLDITDWAKKYSSVFNDFYPALLEAVRYKGKLYGVPQDTEARPLYWRTDVAACIKEKTGKDILADLAAKVEKGEVTWKDVYEYAKLAKETGCAEWGLIHRKGTAHPDLIQFILAYGGKLYDPSTGKLVLDVEAVYKWLATERAFADAGLLPKDMMQWDWAKQIHPTVVDGKTLVFIGGTWHWTEWQTKPYHTDPKTGKKRPLTSEEVKKLFYYTLFPAGEPGKKPVTLSQPFVWYIAANAGHANPKYSELADYYKALAFLLIVKASDPDINAIHSIISAHLPVRRKAAELLSDKEWIEKLKTLSLDLDPEVKKAIKPIVEKTVNPINIEFLAKATKLLEYTHLTPKHPYYVKLAKILAGAIDKVLRGELTPEKAIDYIKQKIKADPELEKSVEIVGSIPAGWKFP